ncbi:hypothetical protein [Actinomadura xylanilytica]|uniref:hypothetical protein n=1 Tax=Actinomadura xylanilytica TaxID=887459 RepID=UPI00255AA2B3|nr:hypothetical protein [Actinomadura xylanilytica]MDL4774606.1 hypothetical protein [Actinomadura xylanilytica]
MVIIRIGMAPAASGPGRQSDGRPAAFCTPAEAERGRAMVRDAALSVQTRR